MKIVSSGILAFAATLGFSSSLLAQNDAPPATPPAAGAPATSDSSGAAGGQGGPRGQRGPRGNFNPEEMRTRMLANIREQLGVTKDDEWNIISERLSALMETRRANGPMGGGGMMGMRGGPGGPGGGGGEGRRGGRAGGSPEFEALQAAIKDNAPDAEVQARLAKLREVRKENDAKVTKAQEDLRAVLNVRQEAILVSYGLLP